MLSFSFWLLQEYGKCSHHRKLQNCCYRLVIRTRGRGFRLTNAHVNGSSVVCTDLRRIKLIYVHVVNNLY